MRYLFTYKSGKKALGTSTVNRGLAIKVGDTTVYPLLVSPNAANASCVRVKVNNEIKSIAYVPSLIIPGVLCGKIGSSYIDPVGINFRTAFFKLCYYDSYHGQYVAYSTYGTAGGAIYDGYAVSVDGKNWYEGGVASIDDIQKAIVLNTKIGVLICMPMYDPIDQDYWNYNIEIYVPYFNGSAAVKEKKFTLTYFEEAYTGGTFKITKTLSASNGDDSVIIGFECEYTTYGNTYYFQKVWNINLNTNVVTVLNAKGSYDQWEAKTDLFLKNINYNNVLRLFLYVKWGDWYYSSDGINFTLTYTEYRISRGYLNGAEVFDDGISYDGINIAQSYTYRPNAYDPVEGKYIRVVAGWHATGQASDKEYYFDIYESTDLINWTFAVRKENHTAIWPQTSPDVNTDGFACVKGF